MGAGAPPRCAGGDRRQGTVGGPRRRADGRGRFRHQLRESGRAAELDAERLRRGRPRRARLRTGGGGAGAETSREHALEAAPADGGDAQRIGDRGELPAARRLLTESQGSESKGSESATTLTP